MTEPRSISANWSIRLACGFVIHEFRTAPVESLLPERAMRRVAALHPAQDLAWPSNLPRPARLFVQPEKIEAVAELPDHPPRLFIWRKKPHRIAKADKQNNLTANGGSATARQTLCAITTASRRRTARATGCFAMGLPGKAVAGGCTAWVRHELRRASGHLAFLVFARRSSAEELFAAAAVLGVEALGIVDRNSLAGHRTAHEAAKHRRALVVGCRLDLQCGTSSGLPHRSGHWRLCRFFRSARNGREKGHVISTGRTSAE